MSSYLPRLSTNQKARKLLKMLKYYFDFLLLVIEGLNSCFLPLKMYDNKDKKEHEEDPWRERGMSSYLPQLASSNRQNS